MQTNKTYRVVIGDVDGKFDVFTKLAALQKKQNFAFAIIAGNLFADPATATDEENEQTAKLIRGEIEVPLPTYFAIGPRELPSSVVEKLESNEGQLCENLTALGRKVSIKTVEGFRVVSLGGSHVESVDDAMSLYAAAYNDADIANVAKDLTDADLLVTSAWPSDIQDGARTKYRGEAQEGVKGLSDLCTAIKPRYHFSTSEHYYEREPYFHNGPAPRSITRFISLAPYSKAGKDKWIYAFNLEPSAPPPNQLPEGTTASPFLVATNRKRKLETQESEFNSFRFSNGNGDTAHDRGHHRGGKRKKFQPPPQPSECYFCLSNRYCATHMIASIGDNAYLATSKGPLTTNATFPTLGFPGHVLIIPLEHAPTMSAISDEEARQACVTEMQRYKGALETMVATRSKNAEGHAQLGAVTWEISRASGVHLHWQFLPVPIDLIQRGLVEAGFEVEAENSEGYPKFAKSHAEMEQAEESGDFLKVMIWSESLRKEMVLPLDKSFRFDLQFPRRVMGKLLGLQQRAHWKDCPQTHAEEEADAQALKEAFKPFDFSLGS